MFQTYELFSIILAYLIVLFLVAYYAEKREREKRSIVSNPYVYALSLAVYCTSWTFYGSVGKAANSGLDFLTIYTGPTLMASLWWIILKKTVRIAKTNRITTISDFIGSRYGNSIFVSALVTIIALVGIAPYLGLQIKAIINSFVICTGSTPGSQFMGWFITLTLGIFAIIFGARRLDTSERHGGLVFAVAFESVIKLIAFLLVGIFVTYVLNYGFGDIFGKVKNSEFRHLLNIGENAKVNYGEWFSLTFLSMMAIMFLPRQFHVSVVENSDENHIKKAMWLFPLYLLLINIFVLPVAFGGLLLGISPSMADNFVLILPLLYNHSFLTLAAFLGGFSAATAMIIVESLALSTMIMNSLVMPALYRFHDAKGFSLTILNIKRLVIIGCVFVGYFFAVIFGEFYSLVDMGLKSFEAVTLFAPPFLIGMYWKGGNRKGAVAGLIGGFIVWLYTLLIPAMLRAEIVQESGILSTIIHSEIFNPTALFGLKGLDKWSHSLLWSLSVNCVLYFGVSLFTKSDGEGTKQALTFVEMLSPERSVGTIQDIQEIENILCQYIGEEEGRKALYTILQQRGIDKEKISKKELVWLRDEAEKILSGAIGASIATLILKDRMILTDKDKEDLSKSMRNMADSLRLSRQELAEANRQLVSLKEFSENIIESAPLGIVTIDEAGVISYWNHYMEDLAGIHKNVAYGKKIRSLLGDMHKCFHEENIRTGEYLCEHFSRVKRNTEKEIIKITISPFKGSERGFVFLFEDITEKRRLERELSQASKHASLGRLTAGVSHEIGNPLASISSLVQEIREVNSTPSNNDVFSEDALKEINSHIERIARIVRSLGDFARISSSEKTLSNISEILDRTINLVRYDKRAKNIEFTLDIDSTLQLRVNPDQMQQVFLNFMLNALDAMPNGGELTISTKEEQDSVEIIFRDTGMGIESEIIDRIFDPFFTTKPLGKGTGLGLSICYGIINDHNGSIRVKSNKGEGTTFTIQLPEDRHGRMEKT